MRSLVLTLLVLLACVVGLISAANGWSQGSDPNKLRRDENRDGVPDFLDLDRDGRVDYGYGYYPGYYRPAAYSGRPYYPYDRPYRRFF
jgi:hypothetical protein